MFIFHNGSSTAKDAERGGERREEERGERRREEGDVYLVMSSRRVDISL
tara:strand:- start:123 stop:269 length:147 start_codon:yes stop_codon:yes gene_type:complete